MLSALLLDDLHSKWFNFVASSIQSKAEASDSALSFFFEEVDF